MWLTDGWGLAGAPPRGVWVAWGEAAALGRRVLAYAISFLRCVRGAKGASAHYPYTDHTSLKPNTL